jgi:hypothetical protein
MTKQPNISAFFPKHLFWDIDMSTLSIETDKDLIISRAFYATTEDTFEQEISILENFYSKEDIIQTLQETKERISNQVCLLVSQKYAIEPFLRFKV